ncbi:hypothetical protein B0H66DRAFT_596762 [Apodospora peruviana]|uniref:Uncharacterized protein n=1 Tax=Apodospora peruviana TaxID=516989 RepID=A0AAE0MFJ3_9PEZI|nr:hypothetical protein B0H66DRAFT_596762 [Apodospora peruviana]
MAATALVGQAPINLGPFTTTFTPPPACTVAVGAVDSGLLGLGGLLGGSFNNVAHLGQACSRGRPIDASSCWPPMSKGVETGSTILGFYSPGVQCPIGYATACSATGGSKGESGWPVQFKLLDGETAIGCCPSGYGCANINGQTCTSVATTAVPTMTCDGSSFETAAPAKDAITAFNLFAPMIQINFQASDKSKDDNTPSETGTAAVVATTTGTAPDKTAATDTTNDPISMSGTQTIDTAVVATTEGGGDPLVTDGPLSEPDNTPIASATGAAADGTATSSTEQKDAPAKNMGMPTSTKVGLGVAGGAIAAVAAIFAVFYIWRRRRSRHEEEELDRLYGMKHHGGSSDFSSHGDDSIPGWYRGPRPLTPVTPVAKLEPYRGVVGGDGGGSRNMGDLLGGNGATELPVAPISPYYRAYRPS